MRLARRTVNFDDAGVSHGNAAGSPGTIMTTFPYVGKGVQKGSDQGGVTAFSVALLAQHGIEVEERRQRFSDPAGRVTSKSGETS